MQTRNALRATVLSVTAIVAFVLQAAYAVTITEFDNASKEQKGEFLVATTKELYHHFKENQSPNAACMEKLVSAVDENGITDLVHLVVDGIDSAREIDPSEYHVEDVMYNAVENACKDFGQ